MSSEGGFARNSRSLRMASAGAAMALALAGCDHTAAQHAAPIRPVLVTNVHHGAQTRDRTFVGTIRPRIESELGFRIANLPAFEGNKASAKLAVVTKQTHTGEQKNAWNEITAPGLVSITRLTALLNA